MQDKIKNKIKDSNYYKYAGIAPEGFILVPLQVIEMLDSFDEWKDFKWRKLDWLKEKSKEVLVDKPIDKKE
jgi:hypothetical protein